jgi:hypothetical protein
MKETVITWLNGGMGNTVYCLLHCCSKELNKGWKFSSEEINFHSLSSLIKNGASTNISMIHEDTMTLSPSDINIVCSTEDNIFIQLLRLYKWYRRIPTYDDLVYFESYKDMSDPEKLEMLVLWLYGFPKHGFNFDIMDFFSTDATTKMRDFIRSRDLTPNDRIDDFVNAVKKMNANHLDEYNHLISILDDALKGKYREIQLKLHQQAFIMTWMMRSGHKFKLMPMVNNTRQFREFLEEQNNG